MWPGYQISYVTKGGDLNRVVDDVNRAIEKINRALLDMVMLLRPMPQFEERHIYIPQQV